MIGAAWVILVLSILLWAFLFPEETLGTIAELKHRLRMHLIQKAGENAANELEQDLYQFAAEHNMDKKQLNGVLTKHHDLIVHRIGEKRADQILGEADPTERFY